MRWTLVVAMVCAATVCGAQTCTLMDLGNGFSTLRCDDGSSVRAMDLGGGFTRYQVDPAPVPVQGNGGGLFGAIVRGIGEFIEAVQEPPPR